MVITFSHTLLSFPVCCQPSMSLLTHTNSPFKTQLVTKAMGLEAVHFLRAEATSHSSLSPHICHKSQWMRAI